MVKDKKSHMCDSFEIICLECKFDLFSLLSLVGVTKWYSWIFQLDGAIGEFSTIELCYK